MQAGNRRPDLRIYDAVVDALLENAGRIAQLVLVTPQGGGGTQIFGRGGGGSGRLSPLEAKVRGCLRLPACISSKQASQPASLPASRTLPTWRHQVTLLLVYLVPTTHTLPPHPHPARWRRAAWAT